MERENKIRDAKRRLNSFLNKPGRKKRVRIHQSAAEDNHHRLRSLEGQCGNCHKMWLNFFRGEGKNLVDVHCQDGRKPVDLYRNTPMGEDPDCPDFTPRK